MPAPAVITPPQFEHAELLLRFAIDLVALALVVLAVRRRVRPEFLAVLACFNLGLFVVLTAIAASTSATAIGFGLFAMLSIIRLRSEPFTSAELGMFFGTLVLALVNGSVSHDVVLVAILDAIVLLPVAALALPQVSRAEARREITLDCIHSDDAALRADVEHRLGIRVTDMTVLELDYVREVTRLSIRYADPAARRAPVFASS
jgi:hypothetical protein